LVHVFAEKFCFRYNSLLPPNFHFCQWIKISGYGVWFPVLLWYSFSSYWKINFNQLQIHSMILASSLQIRKYGHSGDFSFIILLFVDILSLYVINLDVVSFFADSLFLFLTMLNLWPFVFEYRFLVKKKFWITFFEVLLI
jgi:hypothetical protein